MKAHESAYRNVRADEAVNDLLLGAKLSALNSLEDANNKSVNDVADNFGKFLKALGTKEVPLFDRLNKAEERLFKALEQPNMVNINWDDDQKSYIKDAIEMTKSGNVNTMLSKVKQALSGSTDRNDQKNNILVQAFTRAMNNNKFNASTNRANDLSPATVAAIKTALNAMSIYK